MRDQVERGARGPWTNLAAGAGAALALGVLGGAALKPTPAESGALHTPQQLLPSEAYAQADAWRPWPDPLARAHRRG